MIYYASILSIIIYLLIFGFIVYFLISVMRFMRRKNENDRLLLQKIDELTQKIDEQNNK